MGIDEIAYKYKYDCNLRPAIRRRTDFASNPLAVQISNCPSPTVHTVHCILTPVWCPAGVCVVSVVCWYVMCAGGGAA